MTLTSETVRLRDEMLQTMSLELTTLALTPDSTAKEGDAALATAEAALVACEAFVKAASTSNPGYEENDLPDGAVKQLARIRHCVKIIRLLYSTKAVYPTRPIADRPQA